MGPAGGKTFVGFAFGAIQSGLFLLEARSSGNFGRFVVAEVDKALVQAVRDNNGRCMVSIARKDRIDRFELAAVELYDPNVPSDRQAVVNAVAESDEMATALPSVRYYDAPGPASAAGMIAEGLSLRTREIPTVIYAAENHNQAAELLMAGVAAHAEGRRIQGVQTLNTVIGKMSGVITDPRAIATIGLAPLAPGAGRAVLVEEFNRILISRIALAGFRRGIEVFIEKDSLLPFEEAKLYGHNAIHAMIAYLADLAGLETMAQAGKDRRIMGLARKAFLDESGLALIRRHHAVGDALFTPEGYRQYADDLLDRMTRVNLNDQVARVGRDHARKLAYDDRLYGTMRVAMEYGIRPVNLAMGAAAGVLSMIKRRGGEHAPALDLPPRGDELTFEGLRDLLLRLWGGLPEDRYAREMIGLTWSAMQELRNRP